MKWRTSRTNRLNSAVFPCIVLNIKYVWVCDNVWLVILTEVVAYCGRGPLIFSWVSIVCILEIRRGEGRPCYSEKIFI